MRFNFDLDEAKPDPTRSATPIDEVEWVPLQHHPAFTSAASGPAHHHHSTDSPPLKNLLAWDGASRLYFWNSVHLCLHRISVRLGEPDPTSVYAASPSKVLQPDVKLNFTVTKISVNSNGSAILLYGMDGLFIMYLYGRTSSRDGATVCRTVTVGAEIYSSGNNVIWILQVSWHPNSDTHLGILSSDSVFRLFHLSSDLIQPEQAYFLQPVQPGTSRNATSICPVDFSFGGDHLWDCFSVFFLFSDGSIYILCPIIPFGSVYKWESIVDIYNDAQTFGLKSPNPIAVSHSNLAISWLEATFPEITGHTTDEADLSVIRARPYALFDASLSLQGPLRKVSRGEDEAALAFRGAECEGRAVSFLYNLVSKDSILITAWSGGQLQIDALADEIQPVWNIGCPPRLRVDSQDNIRALAMICESTPDKLSTVKLDQPLDSTLWLGHPPPLLRLAIVDLALPKKTGSGSRVMMFIDPLMLERTYTLHDGGIDSIVLHYLPFTSQTSGMNETMRTPSVHPVLSTCQGEYSSHSPLSGFVSLSDSFGYSWIVAVTASQECIVLEMKTLNLLLPHHVDTKKKSVLLEASKDKDTSDIIISKELLGGPKVVLVPQTSPNMRSVSVDSIEGRSMLNEYFKLFHENYVEYAHKVYFELKHHGPHLKRIIDDQHDRLGGAKQRLLQVEEKYSNLEDRINDAVQMQNHLEERLKRLRSLPGVHKKPLSRAEREFKSELDQFSGVELDALRSTVSALNARMRRHGQSPKGNISSQRKLISRRKDPVQESQVSQLKSCLEKLSLVNSENSKKDLSMFDDSSSIYSNEDEATDHEVLNNQQEWCKDFIAQFLAGIHRAELEEKEKESPVTLGVLLRRLQIEVQACFIPSSSGEGPSSQNEQIIPELEQQISSPEPIAEQPQVLVESNPEVEELNPSSPEQQIQALEETQSLSLKQFKHVHMELEVHETTPHSSRGQASTSCELAVIPIEDQPESPSCVDDEGSNTLIQEKPIPSSSQEKSPQLLSVQESTNTIQELVGKLSTLSTPSDTKASLRRVLSGPLDSLKEIQAVHEQVKILQATGPVNFIPRLDALEENLQEFQHHNEIFRQLTHEAERKNEAAETLEQETLKETERIQKLLEEKTTKDETLAATLAQISALEAELTILKAKAKALQTDSLSYQGKMQNFLMGGETQARLLQEARIEVNNARLAAHQAWVASEMAKISIKNFLLEL